MIIKLMIPYHRAKIIYLSKDNIFIVLWILAVVDMNGRYFGGRVVKAKFYDFDKFRQFDLADDSWSYVFVQFMWWIKKKKKEKIFKWLLFSLVSDYVGWK